MHVAKEKKTLNQFMQVAFETNLMLVVALLLVVTVIKYALCFAVLLASLLQVAVRRDVHTVPACPQDLVNCYKPLLVNFNHQYQPSLLRVITAFKHHYQPSLPIILVTQYWALLTNAE